MVRQRSPWPGLLFGIAPAPALAAEPGLSELALLFLLFFAGFTMLMLLSSVPWGVAGSGVSPELLRTFARSKGLVAVPADPPSGTMVERLRRAWSSNPALKSAARGSLAYRGQLDGRPFRLDEGWNNRWFGSPWQRQPFLRMAVELPSLPRSLRVRPVTWTDRLAGRTGLEQRPMMRHRSRGGLVAEFSRRPVDRARESAFLNVARRTLLEEYEVGHGGLHLSEGKLVLIRRLDRIDVRELDRMYEDIATLAERIETI